MEIIADIKSRVEQINGSALHGFFFLFEQKIHFLATDGFPVFLTKQVKETYI